MNISGLSVGFDKSMIRKECDLLELKEGVEYLATEKFLNQSSVFGKSGSFTVRNKFNGNYELGDFIVNLRYLTCNSEGSVEIPAYQIFEGWLFFTDSVKSETELTADFSRQSWQIKIAYLAVMTIVPTLILYYSTAQIWQTRVAEIFTALIASACALYFYYRSEFGREKYGLLSSNTLKPILGSLAACASIQFFRVIKTSSGLLLLINPAKNSFRSDQENLNLSLENGRRVFDQIAKIL